ncbi:GYDIA family GHMP kinase [Aquimarina aquimarini]|uniref:GYDIA family GHMP kinase n=1 Tax=Aquimarina aquimarini TaxID=1191734 RepID=UPI000D555602|nr:GYDIA family GHMP kinase [Aquimarina aquimarini]
MKKSFYSHGKLLITSEYLVLDGVQALAIPTQKGQWLTIEEEENDTHQIKWKSLDENNLCWFEIDLILKDTSFQLSDTTSSEGHDIINTLINILNTAKELNPNFLATEKRYIVESKLEFNRQWGLGSSSTLINNIAQWAKVDAFTLLEKSFGGSGYDIACAQNDSPILYRRNEGKPIITTANFTPSFKDDLFFVYLNQKQDSKASIKHYQSLPLKDFDKAENLINDITSQILNCDTLEEFKALINAHEEIISKIIKTPTIKSTLFPDYTGSIKSLGGWGGDFVLVTGDISEMTYFKNKGYTTIIPYVKMVL